MLPAAPGSENFAKKIEGGVVAPTCHSAVRRRGVFQCPLAEAGRGVGVDVRSTAPTDGMGAQGGTFAWQMSQVIGGFCPQQLNEV